MDRQATAFSPYSESYQASRPATGQYQPLDSGQASSNPFANASYRSPDQQTGNHQGARVNKYETSLPIRVDVEAALVYLFGCVSGVFFLIFEQKNDYVRFHAWQSCLVFVPYIVLYVIISLISSVLSTIVFLIGLVLVGMLMYQAYQNGTALDRFMLPIAGPLAARWTDSE